jgi:hypothetical protein
MKRGIFYTVAALWAAALAAGCAFLTNPENEKGSNEPGVITYEVVQTGWVYDSSDSTELVFLFSEGVALTDNAITLSNGTGSVTRGELTGEGTEWYLGITGVDGGSITVKVTLDGVETGTKTVSVYNSADDAITYNVNQQGYIAGAADSNTIAFAFSADVTLTKEAITVSNGTGEVTTGDLSGSEGEEGILYGPNWYLSITVQTEGTITVSVDLPGVESGAKTLLVYTSDTDAAPTEQPQEVEEADDPALEPNSAEDLNLSGNVITITFGESSAEVSGTVEDVTVTPSGNHVSVSSSAEGVTYVAQGVAADGSLTVASSMDYALYLNGVGLTNTAGPAFNSTGDGTVEVTLVTGTTNRLYDTADNASVNGAFYAKKALTFSADGDGTLELRGRGTKKGHAIAAGGALTIAGGDIKVYEAASDGINAKSVVITGGSYTSYSVGDGIQGDDSVTVSGGTLAIVTTGNKAHGLKGDGKAAPVTISGGASVGIWTSGLGSKGINAGGAVTISGGGINLVSQGGALDETTKWTGSAAIKSDTGVSITGGVLTMSAAGNGSKCISSDGDISISGGTIDLTTTGSAFWDSYEADYSSVSCIKADGSVIVSGGTLTMKSSGGGGKSISADLDITINAPAVINATTTGGRLVRDANNDTSAKAIKADNNLTVNGGTIRISTAGSEAEGLEAKKILTINGGLIEIEANDDCINAANKIIVTGGTIFCNSSTNDGIDSNGTFEFSGGTIISAGAQGAEEGFDCDQSQFKITGGTLIGLGGSTSTPTTSVCTQRTLIYTPASTITTLNIRRTSDAKDLITLDISKIKSYTQRPCILVSSPDFTNTGYTIYTGGSVSGGTSFHGLVSGGTYSPGTTAATVTLSNMVTTSGSSSTPGGGGFGGGPGGR